LINTASERLVTKQRPDFFLKYFVIGCCISFTGCLGMRRRGITFYDYGMKVGGSRPQLDEISNTFYAKSYYIY
jgi:hypothetical protein